MSARLGLPRAVVGGARGLAQRLLARMAFGRQALLSPGVMRPCRVASDGHIFFSVVGFPLPSFLNRTVFAFVSLVPLCFLGSRYAASSDAATLERTAVLYLRDVCEYLVSFSAPQAFPGICWKATRAPGHSSARAPRAAVCLKKKKRKKKKSPDFYKKH